MKRTFVAVGLLLATAVGVRPFAAGVAETPRRDGALTLADLEKRKVVGRLGCELGEIVLIEGVAADGGFTRRKVDEGKPVLRITSVNGRRLESEVVFQFKPANGTGVAAPSDGAAFKYVGYETGGFVGVPKGTFNYVKPYASTGFAFTTSFVVLGDEKRRK